MLRLFEKGQSFDSKYGKKTEIVDHFLKEGILRKAIYKSYTKGRPSSWTYARKCQLKRLINNRKEVNGVFVESLVFLT